MEGPEWQLGQVLFDSDNNAECRDINSSRPDAGYS